MTAENDQVDAMTLISILQEKLRLKEDENSLLQARLLMARQELDGLKNPPEKAEKAEPEVVQAEVVR